MSLLWDILQFWGSWVVLVATAMLAGLVGHYTLRRQGMVLARRRLWVGTIAALAAATILGPAVWVELSSQYPNWLLLFGVAVMYPPLLAAVSAIPAAAAFRVARAVMTTARTSPSAIRPRSFLVAWVVATVVFVPLGALAMFSLLFIALIAE